MKNEEALEIVRIARSNNEQANLCGADLREAELRWANLRGANLREADLRGADLRGADLRGATLRGADLRWATLRVADLHWANLRGADLRGADLREADLREANLCGANLRGAKLRRVNLSWADLREADLREANLCGADLSETGGGILQLSGLPSGPALIVPTPKGWALQIGCWRNKTINDLRALLDGPDEDWPEAQGQELARRRPLLEAFYALAVAHAGASPTLVDDLKQRWDQK